MNTLRKIAVAVLIIAVTAIAGILVYTGVDVIGTFWVKSGPVQGVPETSASAITQPPPSMEGINTHTDLYGTGADPEMITLGPKTGGQPDCPPYPGKTSMEFELKQGTPVLAPLDMVFVGFKNRNAVRRTRTDGEVQSPYNDLELCFARAQQASSLGPTGLVLLLEMLQPRRGLPERGAGVPICL